MNAEQIRFRGTVQGVGFRPAVARVARACGLPGWVRNDGEGVLVALGGPAAARERFLTTLLDGLPPLARVDAVERGAAAHDVPAEGFTIVRSSSTRARTAIAADAALCAACAAEVRDPLSRRYRYPFTTCTHCGPRFSILQGLPYDRPSTTMRGFPMCDDCRREYEDEDDRRYHAQPIACGRCGPTARLVRTDGLPTSFATYSMLDDVDAVRTLLQRGEIVTIKGLGGYQLCCDATNEAAVAKLRARKRRPHKPLALLAEDVATVRRFCAVSDVEEAALTSPANPIVLLAATGSDRVAPSVAPDQPTLGFTLPSTPLHALIMRRIGRPIVCTSGNLTEEPQCTDDADALERLAGIADWALVHDRPIANRVDDSVVRELDGAVRVVRRARGYAPAPIALHDSFRAAPPLTALGGHLKATFCLLRDGRAVLSPHLGDLDEPRTVADYGHIYRTVTALFEHAPSRIAVDAHPGYRTRELAGALDPTGALPVDEIAHHHAHIAACLAEHGAPVDAPAVLGIALDGLGMGEGGELWGGELLVADFLAAERVAALPAVPLLGGDRAAREPWRCALAHLVDALGAEELAAWSDVHAVEALLARRGPTVDAALARAPRASNSRPAVDVAPYPIGLGDGAPARFDLAPLWTALLADLRAGAPAAHVSARFHEGLALALARAAGAVRAAHPALTDVVLSGGVWQNAVLTRRALVHLRADGWRARLHRDVPPNDGCIALGQAAIAAARALRSLE